MAYYEQVTMENPIVASFAKSARFPPSFTSWLTKELSNFYVPLTTTRTRCLGEDCHLSCHSLSINPTFFFGDTSMARSVQLRGGFCFRAHATRFKFFIELVNFYVSTTRFTGVSREIFCKRSHHAKDEIHGANLASKFFHRVEIPRISTAGQLLYPFWRGTTESDLRLSYARGGHTDSSAIGTVLHVELVKAEDALRAYRKSLSLDAQCERPDDKVQRFFYDRVLDNVRFKEFYGAGVRIRDECIPAKKFLELRWCINGKEYPCLRTLFENALDVTDPKSFQVSSCPIAFGLGDAHGGNILVSSAPQERSGCKVLFVDYEVAGFHPVMLDLAKPLYNDVFFKTLYSDLLPATSETGLNYEVTNGTIIVQFSPVIDIMAQAVLNIKTRYLICPLCDEVENIGISLETFVPLLSNALLLCATLTRNFVKDEKALIRNFTAGILLAGAMDWVQLGESFQRLGFDGRCWQMLNKGERCKVASS
ncbi:hypothetical protein F5Y08DRAFT_340671 [Xylaria arbuscula]|nr:hypothetical protein F5Y08DRAFT_340671 [Xylaria arbuscula]